MALGVLGGLGLTGVFAVHPALAAEAAASSSRDAKHASASPAADTGKTASSTQDVVPATDPTADAPLTFSKDGGEVRFLAEINATYFVQPTRHAVAHKGDPNGEKALMRGIPDELDFYQALVDAGFKPGNNITGKGDPGLTVDGDKMKIFLKWEGHDEVPLTEATKCSVGEYAADFRFGGNLEQAKKKNTGCTICFDSCGTGIVSDAAWPTGSVEKTKTAAFYGREDVLPGDGKTVTVICRRA